MLAISTIFDNWPWKLACLIAVGIVIAAEHQVFARRWEKYELARRTMGVATILLLSLPLTLAGMLDFATWEFIAAAFGVAGAITTGMYIDERSRLNAKAREAARAEAVRLGDAGLGGLGGSWDKD
jgi:hypothetical protein